MTTETTQHRPVLIIVAGPNGSGKTTITSKILRHEWLENAVYINPDNVAQEKFGNWNSPEAVLKAAQFCDEWREHCLKERQNIIFESVFSSEQKINFVRKAKQQGYFIRIFFVATNHPSINASRIANRVICGGHDVPISKIISRYQKSILNCKRIASTIDRLYVYDNSIDGSDASLLFRLSDGELIKKYVDDIPEWAKAILQ
ncbi:MAG: zeta toxin family protein [Fibrobacter sp.]|nr:zeta toxin family protein [Fibrobacter sp.]